MPFAKDIKYIVLTGNTYPLRDEIKKFGGEFDADRAAWVLDVPKTKAGRAKLESWLTKVYTGDNGVKVQWI